MATGAKLTDRRTSTPLELDEIYQSIDDLTVALGPDGANSNGALTNLLDSTAENFAGQGEQFHRTIKNLGRFTGTLENNKEELFGTAREMQRFVEALAENDQDRAQLQRLAGRRGRPARGRARRTSPPPCRTSAWRCAKCPPSSRRTATRSRRTSRVSTRSPRSWSSSATPSTRRSASAPLALSNLFHTYNPNTGTLDTRTNIGENVAALENDPSLVLCSVLAQTPTPKQTCDAAPAGAAAARRRSAAATVPPRSARSSYVDRSLAGIVEVEER